MYFPLTSFTGQIAALLIILVLMTITVVLSIKSYTPGYTRFTAFVEPIINPNQSTYSKPVNQTGSDHEEEIMEIKLRKRRLDIERRCHEYSGPVNVWSSKPELRYVASPTILYCCTAKTGTAFWKALLAKLRRQTQNKSETRKGRSLVGNE